MRCSHPSARCTDDCRWPLITVRCPERSALHTFIGHLGRDAPYVPFLKALFHTVWICDKVMLCTLNPAPDSCEIQLVPLLRRTRRLLPLMVLIFKHRFHQNLMFAQALQSSFHVFLKHTRRSNRQRFPDHPIIPHHRSIINGETS